MAKKRTATLNNGKSYSVGQASKLSGISLKTLHHYDSLGLVRAHRGIQGYRLYDSDQLERLCRVVYYRRLGLALIEIDALLRGEITEVELLRRRSEAISIEVGTLQQQQRAILERIDTIMNGSAVNPAWTREAQDRWEDTPQFQQSAKRTRGYKPSQWQQIQAEAKAIYENLAECLDQKLSADSPATRAQVEAHRQHIDRWFYSCSQEMHSKLADLYESDARFQSSFESVRPGLTTFFCLAIREAVPG